MNPNLTLKMPSPEESFIPLWVHPALPKLLKLEKSAEAFGSRAVSLVSLPAGSLFARITTAISAPKKAYTSVQVSEKEHIELNSDLVYINHSCEPSLVFDMERYEVRVVEDRDLKAGELLTFFYPSTEWDMAQPFECTCGAGSGKCKGLIKGAKDTDRTVLKEYYLNSHIVKLLEKGHRNGA
ncbi:hypothetical protein B0A49_13318 [Cryomyces minteri]|uniref:SET domain-containing protein n=1 Tax=Cryomyces minteri TaxID=331657 RepID=A0A4U0W4D8_9PEZI|nr:hypothetical protein B0A49_13318 [Cryomyces minteri]